MYDCCHSAGAGKRGKAVASHLPLKGLIPGLHPTVRELCSFKLSRAMSWDKYKSELGVTLLRAPPMLRFNHHGWMFSKTGSKSLLSGRIIQ